MFLLININAFMVLTNGVDSSFFLWTILVSKKSMLRWRNLVYVTSTTWINSLYNFFCGTLWSFAWRQMSNRNQFVNKIWDVKCCYLGFDYIRLCRLNILSLLEKLFFSPILAIASIGISSVANLSFSFMWK